MSEPSASHTLGDQAVTFHHLGFVVKAIEPVAERFGVAFGGIWDGTITHDPLQRVRVAFLTAPEGPTPFQLELVEPAGEESPVARFLESGGGLHHVCYEVDSLDMFLPLCRSAGILPISEPAPAVAFGGRRIVWVYTPERLLVEYLERTFP